MVNADACLSCPLNPENFTKPEADPPSTYLQFLFELEATIELGLPLTDCFRPTRRDRIALTLLKGERNRRQTEKINANAKRRSS